jgi:hypothetical protein
MALAKASLDAMDERFRPLLAAAPPRDLDDAVARLVGVLRDAYVEIPGLATLVGTTQGHPALEEVYATHNLSIVGWIGSFLSGVARLPEGEAEAAATVLVEASDAVLRHWLRRRVRGDSAVERPLLRELEAMIAAYVRAVLERRKKT